jgi:hypothetical protein
MLFIPPEQGLKLEGCATIGRQLGQGFPRTCAVYAIQSPVRFDAGQGHTISLRRNALTLSFIADAAADVPDLRGIVRDCA